MPRPRGEDDPDRCRGAAAVHPGGDLPGQMGDGGAGVRGGSQA